MCYIKTGGLPTEEPRFTLAYLGNTFLHLYGLGETVLFLILFGFKFLSNALMCELIEIIEGTTRSPEGYGISTFCK